MDELLQHLMDHPSLVKGVGLGARSKEAIDREWTNLASRLNAHGNGATKTGQRWKRYWADLKFKTKNKVAARRREASGTGGGPATLADLTNTEIKILSIIGEGAVSGDIQYRVPILVSSTQSSILNSTSTQSTSTQSTSTQSTSTQSTSTQSTSTQSTSTQSTSSLSTSVLNTKEIEGCLIEYQNEEIVTATESPPPSAPASFQTMSPSSRGHTSRVNIIEATAAASDSPQQPPATSARSFDTTEATAGSPNRPAPSRRTFESPVSRRQFRQPRRSSSSTLTREVRTGQRVDQTWVVELERRRVDAESRLADAAMITAEAARVQAEASRMQAEASRMQAEASRDHAAALNTLLEILRHKYT